MPAEQLAHDIDVGVVDDGHAVGREHFGRERNVAFARHVPDGHARDLQTAAGAERDVVAVVVHQPGDCGADVAAPQQADAHDLFVHHGSGPSVIQADMRISSS